MNRPTWPALGHTRAKTIFWGSGAPAASGRSDGDGQRPVFAWRILRPAAHRRNRLWSTAIGRWWPYARQRLFPTPLKKADFGFPFRSASPRTSRTSPTPRRHRLPVRGRQQRREGPPCRAGVPHIQEFLTSEGWRRERDSSRVAARAARWPEDDSIGQPSESEGWRRERDSNPRNPSGFSGFQDHRHRPLGHPSASKVLGIPQARRVLLCDQSPCVTESVTAPSRG